MPDTNAVRLLRLFSSNQRSIGRYDPRTGKMFTEYRAPTAEDTAEHITGKIGLGLVPILDNDTCLWAAIDIDNHDQEEDIPIAPIAEAIATQGYPLVPCRSKSGGVHVYLFLAQPMAATRVRSMMSTWAASLGYAGVEIFPKQAHLATGRDDKKQLGNWINLPYLNADDTVRYCLAGGKKLTLEQFLDHAENLRQTKENLSAGVMTEHPQAPPCVQRMLMQGVGSGQRNEGLYNITVYLRKSNPDGYHGAARHLNTTLFDKPLSRQELDRTVISAAKPDYNYRCNEEPIKSLCDRITCVKRKYGVTSDYLEQINEPTMPAFTEMVKVLTDPPRWGFIVGGKPVNGLTTAELLDWRLVRVRVAEALDRVMPMIKASEWDRMINEMMGIARHIEAPSDASPRGVLLERLREFAGKAHINGSEARDLTPLIRGIPVPWNNNGQACILLRGTDFIQYLKRVKAEDLRTTNVWMSIQEKLGISHTRVLVGTKRINVWCIPIDKLDLGSDDEPPQFTSEL